MRFVRATLGLHILFLALLLVVASSVCSLVFAGPTPNPGVTLAKQPLKISGRTVFVDTNGTLKVHLVTTSNLTISGTCVGCGNSSGGGGSGAGTVGTSTVDPTKLGTLALWLKADAGVFSDTGCTVGITSGGAVACWQDQSGNHLDFTQSTAGLRPPYYWWQRASHPALAFNAHALFRANATGLNLASFTQCAVGQLARDDSATGEMFVVFSGANGTVLGNATTNPYEVARAAGPYEGAVFTGGILPVGDWSTICQTFDDATKLRRLWVNGALISSTTAAGSVDYTGAVPTVGSLQSTAGGENWQGPIGEVLEWNSALSGAVLGSAFTYTRQRWNEGYGFGGSGSGSSSPDPMTANTWSPLSGTAVVSSQMTVPKVTTTTPSAMAGMTATGTWNFSGATVTGIAATALHGFMSFVAQSTVASNTTNDTSQTKVIGASVTPAHCEFTQEGSLGSGAGTCTIALRDSTSSTTLCSSTFTCNESAGVVTSFDCGGSSASASDIIDMRRISPLLSVAPAGILQCSY